MRGECTNSGSFAPTHRISFTDNHCKSRCDNDPSCTGYTSDSFVLKYLEFHSLEDSSYSNPYSTKGPSCSIHTQISLSGDDSLVKLCHMKIPSEGRLRVLKDLHQS